MGLSKALTQQVADYSASNSMGSKFRAKRIGPLIVMITKTYEAYGEVKILDIGLTYSCILIWEITLMQRMFVRQLPSWKITVF